MSCINNILLQRLKKIQALIAALYDQQLATVGTSNIEREEIRDGQATVSTSYQNPTAQGESIKILLQQERLIINQLEGFGIYMIPSNHIR